MLFVVRIFMRLSSLCLLSADYITTPLPPPNTVAVQMSPLCPSHWCNSSETSRIPCRCSPSCRETGLCCLDVFDDEAKEVEFAINDIYVLYQNKDFNSGIASLVIGKCPRSWNSSEDIRIECEEEEPDPSDPTALFPMTSNKTLKVYKNLACATCHEGSDVVFKLQFHCQTSKKMRPDLAFQVYLKNKSCLPLFPDNVEYETTPIGIQENNVEWCPRKWTNSLSKTRRLTNWRCNTYLAPFTYNGRRFKNIFCAKCNGIDVQMDNAVCRRSLYPDFDSFEFNLNPKSLSKQEDFKVKACKGLRFYDPFRNQCRLIKMTKSPPPTTSETLRESKVVSHQCQRQRYRKPDFAMTIKKDSPEEKMVIVKSKILYREGEFELLTSNRVEVCKKNESANICLHHYCMEGGRDSHLCKCSRQCLETGNCCLDAFTEEEIQEAVKEDVWDCLPTLPLSVFAISACPQNTNDSLNTDKCQTDDPKDPFLKLPVVSKIDNRVYANLYCAACHRQAKVRFLKLKLMCSDLLNIRNRSDALKIVSSNSSSCTFHFNDLRLVAQKYLCSSQKEDSCPKSWKYSDDPNKRLIYWKCLRYTARVNIDGKRYANIYCAQCNGIQIDSNTTVQCDQYKATTFPQKGSFILMTASVLPSLTKAVQ